MDDQQTVLQQPANLHLPACVQGLRQGPYKWKCSPGLSLAEGHPGLGLPAADNYVSLKSAAVTIWAHHLLVAGSKAKTTESFFNRQAQENESKRYDNCVCTLCTVQMLKYLQMHTCRLVVEMAAEGIALLSIHQH